MVEDEPPAHAPTLEDPEGFDTLSDDLVLRACLRAPFVTHGALAAVCARFKSLLRSDAFGKLRLEYGLAEHGVVIAGGYRGESTSAECRMWSGGRWRPIPPMSSPRCGACSVIIDNEMWVMGGEDGDGNVSATVEVYSPKKNSWRSCTPMSQHRRDAFAGVVGGRLVVVGGVDGDGDVITSAEAYTGNGWTPLPHIPYPALMATACVLNGRLYVIGGLSSNRLQVLEMTEENGLSWSRKADLPARRHGASSAVLQGKIWVIGGGAQGGSSQHRQVHWCAYDAEADTWARGPPLPTPQRACAATVIDGRIHLFDVGHRATCGAVLLG